eukprot:CAMPEP_0179931864 /NCGR_PEP_ID=MMETSP0983-20121128/10922_1 /TAXON_ID=483367 /ORGANISM="non described non described, Strain CCMP 2436" /LENGTH=262 /DNA_ID=CAMNT_0021836351 /DNA_START=321 /DNA_END=1111 /DNA_ORIENTATION=+
MSRAPLSSSAALGERAQRGDVLEHLGERHLGLDQLDVPALVEQLIDHAAARVYVADHVAHVVLGHDHLHAHHRLHQTRVRGAEALARGCAAGDLKGHHGRVNVVVGAVDQGGLEADHGEARDDTGAHDALEALGHAGDVLLGHGAALDVGDELEALRARLERLEADLDLGVLAAAARLLLVDVLNLGRLGDALAVSHLRGAHVGLDLELALHPVDDDLEVQLAHAGDHGLARVLIATEAERRVLGSELDERVGLFSMSLCSF